MRYYYTSETNLLNQLQFGLLATCEQRPTTSKDQQQSKSITGLELLERTELDEASQYPDDSILCEYQVLEF